MSQAEATFPFKRWLLWSAYLLLLGLLLATLLLLGTQRGNQALLPLLAKLEPRLSLTLEHGLLLGDASVSQLRWRSPGVEIDIPQADWSWDWQGLWSGTLSLERLHGQGASIVISEGADSAAVVAEAEDASPFALPFAVKLRDLQLEQTRLTVYGQQIAVKRLQAAAQWDQDGLSVSPLQLQDLLIVLAAAAEPAPVTSATEPVSLPEVVLPFPIRLEGLQLQNGRLELAGVAYVVDRLQLSARAQGSEIELQQLTLEIPQATVQVRGEISLQDNYPLDLQIEASRLAFPPFSQLSANLQANGNLENLTLDLKTTGQLRSQLTGTVNLLDPQLPYRAQVAWQQFGWPLEQPQYYSAGGSLDLKGTRAAYQFTLTAQASGHQLPALTIQARGQGDDQQLSFSPLTIDVYQGQIAATGTLVFTDGFAWQGALTGSDLNPAELWAELPGTLSGSLLSAFNWQDDAWSLQLQDIQLTGVLADQPFRLQGQVSGNRQGVWQLAGLQLQSGENRLLVTGQISEQTDLQGTLEVVDLQQSIPSASGRGSAQFTLTGRKESPQLDFSLAAEQLAFAEQHVGILNATGQLQLGADPHGTVQLQLEDGVYQGTQIEQLELQLTGNLRSHLLSLELYGEQLSLQSSVQGQLVGQLWSGILQNSWAQTPLGRWEQEASAQLRYDLDQGQLVVARHCWRSDAASLCLTEDASVGTSGDLSLRLDNFAGNRLTDLLTNGVDWQGRLSATAKVHWAPEQLPRVDVALSAGSGSFAFIQDGQTLQADYQLLELSLLLAEGLATSRLQLQSETLGRGTIQLQLSLLEKERPIQGEIVLTALQLQLLQPLLQISAGPFRAIGGTVDAAATIAGTLKGPLLNGSVSLTDGQLKGPKLPTSLEQIRIRVEFDQDQAKIAGDLLLGNAPAQLAGAIDWRQPPVTGWLTLKGARHRFNFPPEMTLLLSPDLRLDYQPELLKISGTVAVPYGRIKIKELPKGAVNRSADVVIVDAPVRREQQQLLPLALAVQVTLLEEVKIDAFGLKADLAGALAIKQAPGQSLSANGSIELQEGTYRAFGQNLQINKGMLHFSGPLDEPFLDVDAIRNPNATSDNVVVGLRLRGAAKQPKVTIYSEPAMAQQEALSYLLRGRALTTGSDTSQDTLIATALLGAGLGRSEGLVSELGQSLGVNELAVSTRGEGTDTQVAVSGYLLPGVQVSYGVGLFSPASEITLRYEILPQLMLEAISGLRSAVDLLYQFEF